VIADFGYRLVVWQQTTRKDAYHDPEAIISLFITEVGILQTMLRI
jgi:hypothetical protein